MRFPTAYAILLSLCTTVPALSQNQVLVAGATPTTPASSPTAAPASSGSETASTDATPATAPAASQPVDLTGFRDSIAQRKKALNNQVTMEKTIVKKNGEIIQDAKKIAAENKKLETQRKQLEAQNAELDRERQQMQAEEESLGGTQAPAPSR
jgi:hypothetical protein